MRFNSFFNAVILIMIMMMIIIGYRMPITCTLHESLHLPNYYSKREKESQIYLTSCTFEIKKTDKLNNIYCSRHKTGNWAKN